MRRRRSAGWSKSRHRTYPGRIPKPPPGMCRWCGIIIRNPDDTPNRRKTFCGSICVTHHLLRSDPSVMRRHVFYRDRGKCATCGFEHKILNGDWEADHILPLCISLGDPEFWEPENVRVLCKKPCHQEKPQQIAENTASAPGYE